MLEELYNRKAYPPATALEIETQGAVAVSVANRWLLGWPDRVKALLQAGSYMECLKNQVEQEKTVLAEAPNLTHLTRREILAMYEIPEAPPAVDGIPK